MDNLNRRFAQICRSYSGKVAIYEGDSALTFGQLWRLSAAAASFLSSTSPGHAVGLLLPAMKEFAPLYFGSLLAGKAVVPLNFMLTPRELAGVVADAGLETVITSRALLEYIPGPLDFTVVYLEDLAASFHAAASHPPHQSLLDKALALPPPTPATIIYTAGTSGPPKGVVLSHANLLANTDSCVDMLGLKPEDTLLASLPFFHAFGLSTGLVMPVLFGGSTVLLPRFAPGPMLDLIGRHRVNIILTIPSIWTLLLKTGRLSPETCGSLKLCISGGEPLPGSTYDAFARALGFPILEGYGLTECSPVVSLTPPDNPRKGSVGRPLPGVQVKVLGPQGELLGPNQPGEIHVWGPNVFRGYHNRPELTGEVLHADGWFATGDRGSLDRDGSLYVTGRLKDLIISGGENVSPREIEEVLLTCPGVLEAAVIGVPDSSRGEAIKAFVAASADAGLDELAVKSHCRRHLAAYKVPRYVQFLEKLPRSYTGKILKRALPV